MGMQQSILTFGAAPVQFPVPSGFAQVHSIIAEPLRSNAAVCSVGGPTVTANGSGVGVMQELAAGPGATVPLDRFLYQPSSESNRIDPTVFYAQGATGQGIKITYLII